MTSTLRTASDSVLPGTRRLPLIGQTAGILRLNTRPLDMLREQFTRFGHLSALTPLRDGEEGLVFAFGAELNREVLGNPDIFNNPSLEKLGDSAFTRLSSGLVTMNGERHRQQRRMMMPAFHKQAVAHYADLMVCHTDEMLNRWQQADRINLMPELRRLVLHIVSHTLFGLDESNERLGDLIVRWSRISSSAVHLLVPPLRQRLNRLSAQLERELLTLIERKRHNVGQDILSMLIQTHDEDGTRLTDAELVGQLAVLFIAGHETTVNALAWMLIMLAHKPAMRLELVEGLKGTAPTMEQVYNVPLLDRFIKETMRLLPPAVYTARMVTQPFTLGSHRLAQNSMVILSHFITHRLPEIYDAPEVFRPERWETLDVSPYEYMPFSAGSRMCIGATFASLEMRIVLAMLLQRVQVRPLKPVDYQVVGISLRPKVDVVCTVHPAGERLAAWSLESGSLSTLVR
jgi:cytochrome P450